MSLVFNPFSSQLDYVGAASTNPAIPEWRKYTVLYSDLAAAALTNDIELFELPAKGLIHHVVISHSASFLGGAITTYDVGVGISGDLEKYASLFDVNQSPAGDRIQSSLLCEIENKASTTSVRIQAVSTGANLNAATQGSVDVWVLWSTLP